ncbi:MAG: ribonuclease HII [Oscillospiraceae bacterium]|jgi:ribonuclease HII|nr:ribonuclease HII [Oscillospiraceae bacterium]
MIAPNLELPIGAIVCGVDEAGRGSLAGDVYAAAVVLPQSYDLPKLGDSKTLSASRRNALDKLIREQAVAFSVASASVEEIDALGITDATLLAMNRAIAALQPRADFALIDGNVTRGIELPCRAVVGGDALVPAISAASILAKVARDRYITELTAEYPGYGFERHKGYGTKLHYEMLAKLGATPLHRTAFMKSDGGKWAMPNSTT